MNIPAELIWIIIASIGAMAKYLDDYLRRHILISFPKLMATMLVGGFTGYMLAELTEHYSPDYAKVAAGLGGFLGTRTMDFLLPLLENFIKSRREKDE